MKSENLRHLYRTSIYVKYGARALLPLRSGLQARVPLHKISVRVFLVSLLAGCFGSSVDAILTYAEVGILTTGRSLILRILAVV